LFCGIERELDHFSSRGGWTSAPHVELDAGTSLSTADQAELSELVDLEVEASGKRAAAALADLGK